MILIGGARAPLANATHFSSVSAPASFLIHHEAAAASMLGNGLRGPGYRQEVLQ
jgi:hypothetical protein